MGDIYTRIPHNCGSGSEIKNENEYTKVDMEENQDNNSQGKKIYMRNIFCNFEYCLQRKLQFSIVIVLIVILILILIIIRILKYGKVPVDLPSTLANDIDNKT